MSKEFLYKDLSYKLQGIFFEIRNRYGPGQKESVYANLVAEQLDQAAIPYEREKRLTILPQETNKTVGIYQPDFLIDGKIILELKSTRYPIRQDEQQLYYYLRNSSYEVGYLINFGLPELFIKRIIYSNSRKPFLPKMAAVLLCLFVFSFAFIRGANAAELLLFPDPVEITNGGTALVEIRLDTQEANVNVAQIVLTFPPNALTVRDVLFGGSIFPLQPERPFLGIDSVKIVAGAPSGFGGNGIIARLVVSAPETRRADSTVLAFDEEATSVLLNDGRGTPASLTMRSTNVRFTSAPSLTVSSSSHQDENSWSSGRTAIFHWEVEEGAQYSYKLVRDPTQAPDDIPDTPVGDIKFENLEDGIYYFALRKLSDPPDAVFRRRVQIDTGLPEAFDVLVTKQPEVYSGDYWYAIFAPHDAVSGIARIEVAETRGNEPLGGAQGEEPVWYEAASPYPLRDQSRSSTLRVRAVDLAGNIYEVSVLPEPGTPSWYWFVGTFAGLVGIVLLVQWRRKWQKRARIDISSKKGPA